MIESIVASLYTSRPPLLWGAPGVGKSALSLALARLLKVKPIVIYLSHKADNEIHGQPIVSKDTIRLNGVDRTVVEMAPPRYVIEACNAIDEVMDIVKKECYKGSLLVFEELTTVQPSSAGPALSIFGDRLIGEIRLPDHVAIMAVANPVSMAACGWDLKPPTTRRFCHIPFRLEQSSWIENFPSYWGSPPSRGRWDKPLPEEEWAQDRALVAAFIRTKPDRLYAPPKESCQLTGCWTEGEQITVGGWACPATWDDLSEKLTILRLNGDSEVTRQESCIGHVGHGSGMDFLQWMESMKLPSPEEILANPSLVSQVPFDRADQLYYLVTSCLERVRHLKRIYDQKRSDTRNCRAAYAAWKACWEVTGRILLGPLEGTSYHQALQQYRSGKRSLAGPKDIGAVGAHALVNSETTQPHGVDIQSVTEIDLFPQIPRLAGLDWRTESGNTGRSA